MNPLLVARRIAYRSSVALGHHRTACVLGIGALALSAAALSHQATGVEVAGVQVTRSGGQDCADITMAYVVQKTPSAAQAAYNCLGGPLAASVSEQELVQQAQQASSTGPVHVTRVGDHPDNQGGKLVYFALDSQNSQAPTVGYIIYLGSDGKVWNVE